jgi:hypothetical protein
MDEAEREWANMKQRRGESVESFKRRVKTMMDKHMLLGLNLENDPRLANTFIRKLDPTRFADLQCHIVNSPLISTRDALPQNLFEAAELAENWHTVTIKGTTPNQASVLLTKAETTMVINGSEKKQFNKSQKGQNSAQSNQKPANGNNSKPPFKGKPNPNGG